MEDPARSTTFDVGTNPTAMAYDGTHLYVTNLEILAPGSVTVIDPATNSTVGPPIPVGQEPVAIAYDGTSLWVANYVDDTVTRLPPR